MILIHPGPLSPGVHLAARSLITRPSSFLSIRSFSARSMSSRDEPTTQSGFSSSPSNAGTLTSTRPRVTTLVAAPLPSGPSGTLPSDATGPDPSPSLSSSSSAPGRVGTGRNKRLRMACRSRSGLSMTEWSVSYNTSNATYTSSRSLTSSGFSPYANWWFDIRARSSSSSSSPAPSSSSPSSP